MRRGHYRVPLAETMDLISDSLPNVAGQGVIVRLVSSPGDASRLRYG